MKTKFISTLLLGLSAMASSFAGAPVPAVQLRVDPERTSIHPDSQNRCVVQIELEGKSATSKRALPLNISLVLDRSGSMQGAKLERARQAACLAIDRLGDNDTFSLVTYDDSVNVLIPPQRVRDRDALKSLVRQIECGGSTALYAGVQRGAEQVRKFLDAENVTRVILLSDGIANVGPSKTEDLSRLGKTLRKEGISVTTVGLGDDYNEDLMTALAEASHANYYYVRDAEKLPDVFARELGEVQSVIARNVILRVTLPEGVRAKGVLGEPELAFRGQRLEVSLSDFVGSQTRRFLIECEPGSLPDGPSPVATAELVFNDIETGQEQRQSATAEVRRAANQAEADSSLNVAVGREVAIQENRLAKEKAVALADNGRLREAAGVMAGQAAINRALPASVSSPKLESEAKDLDRGAAKLSSGVWESSDRKQIQYDNYRDKNQKN